MNLKPLQFGVPRLPFRQKRDVAPEYMRHTFESKPLAGGIGTANVAYETFGAQLQSLIGAGTGYGNSPFRPGAPPMIATRVVQYQGLSYTAGQFKSQPLALPPQS